MERVGARVPGTLAGGQAAVLRRARAPVEAAHVGGAAGPHAAHWHLPLGGQPHKYRIFKELSTAQKTSQIVSRLNFSLSTAESLETGMAGGQPSNCRYSKPWKRFDGIHRGAE